MRSKSRNRLASADVEILSQDRSEATRAIYERGEFLKRLGLCNLRLIEGEIFLAYTENSAFHILKNLLQLGRANVYELAKFSKNAGHYSTILRALRRMEKRGLVNVVPKKSTNGRSEKVYEVTLFGELVESLASGGWKGLAEKIAVIAPRFQDCQRAHAPFDAHYYWRHAHRIIESLKSTHMPNDVRLDVERVVTESESEWIKTNLIIKLSDRQTMSQNLNYLRELTNVPWIGCIISQLLNEYYDEWEKWRKTLNAFRQDLSLRLP